MQALLKNELKLKTVKEFGSGGGGCINSGQGYETDIGKFYAKYNNASDARVMFDGEYESLKAICSTETVNAPKPIKVINNPKGGAILITDYIEIRSLGKWDGELGKLLAKMHLHNSEMKEKVMKQGTSVHKDDTVTYVDKFGFHVPTCCGSLPQGNNWEDDWCVFFTKKLDWHINRIVRNDGDRELNELWSKLQRKIPDYFKGFDVVPALVHGDLWGGNTGATENGPAIFDPASFYGDGEYDLGIARMFGGIGKDFFDNYHKMCPKKLFFDKRIVLYELFHYLNHWNHFGSGYRSPSISRMKQLT